MGDLSGVVSPESISYLRSLGVGAVRLNSIFASHNYPEDYYNAESLTEVDRKLGSVEDVRTLAKKLHANNMSLILDLPVHIVKYNKYKISHPSLRKIKMLVLVPQSTSIL